MREPRSRRLPTRLAVARLHGAIRPDILRACLLAVLFALALFAAQAQAGDTAAAGVAQATPAAERVPLISQEALLARQARKDPQLFVLDVRTPQEYAAGHVPGAVNVPYDQVAGRLAEIPRDKDVVIYCRTGRRTGLAAEALGASGYTRLAHLEGDMTAWLERNQPVEKP